MGDTSERTIWVNGAFRPWREVTVHLLSHSLQRGSLVFDYMGIHEGARGPAIFRLAEHVARFARSVRCLGLELPYDEARLRGACVETAQKNPGSTAIKVCAYLPSLEVDVVPMDPRLEIAIAAYDVEAEMVASKPAPYRRPAICRLKLERARKRIDAHLPTDAKAAANYLGVMMAKRAARAEGYDEIVTLDETGLLAEGPTTNIFLVDHAGQLHTPGADAILEGITRDAILTLAKEEGIEARVGDVSEASLFAASEAFLSGTSAGLWPVVSIDGLALAAAPGPVTRRLAGRLQAVLRGEDDSFAHWLTPCGDETR